MKNLTAQYTAYQKTGLFVTVSLLFTGLAVVTSLHGAHPAFAAGPSSVSQATTGLSDTGASTGQSVPGLIKDILNILSFIVGAASVIMLVIGGMRYILSGGDSSAISSAKNTIVYAIVGLVVAVFAQIIVQFVLGKLS